MRRSFTLVFLLASMFLAGAVTAADNTSSKNPNVEQAKQDYRAYLEQLKALNRQYKEVTGEIQKVMREEGIPVWDDNAGGVFVSKVPIPDSVNQVFGDADIQETENEVIVKVDLPGLDKDALKVSVLENRMLRISGERQSSKEEKEGSSGAYYHKSERQHGSFERLIKLPVEVQDTGMQAKYENGVLTVTVLKAPNAKKEVAVAVQ